MSEYVLVLGCTKIWGCGRPDVVFMSVDFENLQHLRTVTLAAALAALKKPKESPQWCSSVWMKSLDGSSEGPIQ